MGEELSGPDHPSGVAYGGLLLFVGQTPAGNITETQAEAMTLTKETLNVFNEVQRELTWLEVQLK
jgi:hypothetical protein